MQAWAPATGQHVLEGLPAGKSFNLFLHSLELSVAGGPDLSKTELGTA